jgi:transposase
VVGFGDWSNKDSGGVIKGSPSGPVKRLERQLGKHCRVVSVDEFRTSKLHFDCRTRLHNQYSQKQCKDGAVKTVKVHSVLHCRNSGCNGMTVNRDVNAARNILALLTVQLEGGVRPAEYSRTAPREVSADTGRHNPAVRG